MNMHYSKIFLKAMFGYFKEFLTKEMQWPGEECIVSDFAVQVMDKLMSIWVKEEKPAKATIWPTGSKRMGYYRPTLSSVSSMCDSTQQI